MAKQTNSGSYLLPICDFSRGSLNVRLQTTPAKVSSFDVCFFYSEAVVLSAAESVEAAGAVSVPACVVGSVR